MTLLSKLGNYKNFGLLIIRIGLGIMFIYHGLPKLMGGPKTWTGVGGATNYIGIHFFHMLWGLIAAIVETFGGFLVIIGLAFRPACLLLVIDLLVAANFHLHQTGPMGGLGAASHAIEDAIMFAGLLFIGPGKYSADKK